MKKWQKRFIAVAKALGFIDKVKDGKLSADEQKQIFAEYEKKFATTFQADKEADEDAEPDEGDFILSEKEQTEIGALILDEGGEDDDNSGEGDEGEKKPAKTPKTGKEANAAMKKTIIEKNKQIDAMSKQKENDKPAMVIKAGDIADQKMIAIVMGHTPHTATHLFGNESDFMSLSKWWNKITATRKEVEVERLSDSDKDSFKKAFNEYCESLINRSNHLTETNAIAMLDYQKMVSGTSSFSDFTALDAAFGEYNVRRQDIILAFFRSLPSVSGIFPVQSGVRNMETVPTVQFGELSQGYREGKIFKGNVKMAAEIYRVIDVMFKYKFDDMIALQKRYVMELSKGSSPFQWTWIEWLVLWFGRQLFNEQQRRRIVGARVPQQSVNANPAMLASDGVLRAILRAEKELKVLPFKDLGIYSEVDIVDYTEQFWDYVDDILPNMEGMRLYANEKHKKWYLRAFRKKYGLDGDFQGTKSALIDVNPEQIIWVPNMPKNCFKMWVTTPGNINSLEYVPNEMLGFKFREGFEYVTALSRWMEGTVVQMIGVKYKTEEELVASGRQNQWLFTNFPVSELEPDATTVNGRENTEFLTGANTEATAITDITSASEELVYRIICGSLTNKTTIAKEGKFAKIKEAWTPTAVGDFIELYAELEDYNVVTEGKTHIATRPTGNFLELERRVS